VRLGHDVPAPLEEDADVLALLAGDSLKSSGASSPLLRGPLEPIRACRLIVCSRSATSAGISAAHFSTFAMQRRQSWSVVAAPQLPQPSAWPSPCSGWKSSGVFGLVMVWAFRLSFGWRVGLRVTARRSRSRRRRRPVFGSGSGGTSGTASRRGASTR
jgi:hypothetical protein